MPTEPALLLLPHLEGLLCFFYVSLDVGSVPPSPLQLADPNQTGLAHKTNMFLFTELESLTGTSQIDNFTSVKCVPYVFIKGNPLGSKWLTLVAQ